MARLDKGGYLVYTKAGAGMLPGAASGENVRLYRHTIGIR